MNCANHTEVSAVAYCRTCGKPLCAACTRDVKGVIYCENCLAARLEGVQPPPSAASGPAAPFVPPAPVYAQPQSGPNPTVAGILAGFFPIGVGAVYSGQYAKGLAHLGIFVLLVLGFGEDRPWYINTALAIGLGFFYVYQIIDAVRTAKAIQLGQPAPDPLGLSHAFSPGEKAAAAKVPVGAVVLIGLGILFLLHSMGLEFGLDRFWPLILIAIGAWLFIRRWGLVGVSGDGCACDQCRTRGLMGPSVLVTLGTLFLLEQLHVVSFGRTWPVVLLVVGLVKLLQGTASSAQHIPPKLPGGPAGPAAGGSNPGAEVPQPQPPANEVRNV